MPRNLLFINKYPEIREEFTKELADKEIEIDTADNGIDAAILLRKKEYQVVVTGLVLDGFNGEQIVTYVNKMFPDTVCIIYTTTISAAQLHFFINKRDVYRVFLRPVNFRLEFFQALEEAFEYNDIKKKSREEEAKRQEEIELNRSKIHDMEKQLDEQKKGWQRIEQFSRKVVSYTVDAYAAKLNDKEKEKLRKTEEELVCQACHNHDLVMLRKVSSIADKIIQ